MPHHDLKVAPLLRRSYWIGGVAILALTLTAAAAFEVDRRGDRDVLLAFNRTRLGRDVQILVLEREGRRSAFALDPSRAETPADQQDRRILLAKLDSLVSLESSASAGDSAARVFRAQVLTWDSTFAAPASIGDDPLRAAVATAAFTQLRERFTTLRRLDDIALTAARSDDYWVRATWLGSVVIEVLLILAGLFFAHRLILQNVAAVIESQHEVLDRLASANEYRDDDTGKHTQRVGELAARIALTMGYDADTAATIRRAAALHDVGKIGVPDGILLKEGKLSPEELEVMRQHTIIGEHILEGGHSLIVSAAARIARSHHEWWNGAGYPDRLAGERIPIEARITAVADVFDSIRSKRPYRDAWALEVSLDEIRSGAGTQFDPGVVNAFFEGHCYEGYAVEGGASQDANAAPLIRQLAAKVAKPSRAAEDPPVRPPRVSTLTTA
jgi:HD-GYP domain-containing protein (c-di-GMP phosphodiesterase class II)